MPKSSRSVVRRGTQAPNAGRPLVPPLEASVMYHYQDVDEIEAVHDGRIEGFDYARDGHPNAALLADKLSWMEGATKGLMTGSGMSALSAAFLTLLEPGDTVAAATQLYGRSLRLVQNELPRMGFASSAFDAGDSTTFAEAITQGTRIVLTEIVSNPMLRITDFHALARAAKEVGALLLVDNTFTTPWGFQPLEHGADLVMHSVTKMLSGHSDLNLGYLGAIDTELLGRIDENVGVFGLNASPYNCWMADRGLHTFDLRFKQAQANAEKLSVFLSKHPKVSAVHYPGLASHPDHDLAVDLLTNGFGTMVSFVLQGSRDSANAFLRAATNIPYGPTLGDVATIMVMPAFSSHRKLSRRDRLHLGIEDNLVRVSVGIESFELIQCDFADALAAV